MTLRTPSIHALFPEETSIRAAFREEGGFVFPDEEERAAWFCAGELEEYAHFRAEKRRREWLGVRILLKTLLLQNGMIQAPREAEIFKNPGGMPFLRILRPENAGGNSVLSCSLSHARGYVFAAYSAIPGQRVGIDGEVCAERIVPLREKFVSEGDWLFSGTESAQALTVLWTFKEALSKLLGTGWAAGFTRLQCKETHPGCCTLRDAEQKEYGGRYTWIGAYAVSLVSDRRQ